MTNFELIFIPSPGLSHLVSTVESAKLLLACDPRLSITVLIMKLPTDKTPNKYTPSPRLRFLIIPNQDFTAPPSSRLFIFDFINSRDVHVRRIISDLMIENPDSSRLAGVVLDMFCTKFIEVANEFDLPSYVFFTSGACALGLFNHLVSLKFDRNEDLTKFKDSDAELSVPCFSAPFPAKCLPSTFVSDGPMPSVFLGNFKRIVRETRGVMVNTFREMETFAVESLMSDDDEKCPRVYPVGPILNLGEDDKKSDEGNEKWLDGQPEGSVVFLCFGTMGSFEAGQVKEIASALENSGKRFLWSMRKPGEKGVIYPTEYEDFSEVLPEGFLERTETVGRVTGWADQVGVLAHRAVGGFVSHCGWNSTLESVWFGVPVATFPLYAEQQMNAFLLVKELGMAEEIRIDYQRDIVGGTPSEVVGAEEIEAAIRRLMEGDSGVRRKVKEMQRKSREALKEGGSSYNAQKDFIEDVIKNIN